MTQHIWAWLSQAFLLPRSISSPVTFLGGLSQRELSYFWIVHRCQGHAGHLLLHFLMKPFLRPTALCAPEAGRVLSAYHTQRFCPSVRPEACSQPSLSWEPIQDLLLAHRSCYENEFSFAIHKYLCKWNCTIHTLNGIILMLELVSGSQNQKGIWFQTEPLASKGCWMEYILKPQLPIDKTFKVALLLLYSLLCLCLVCSSPGCWLEAALGCRGTPNTSFLIRSRGKLGSPPPSLYFPSSLHFMAMNMRLHLFLIGLLKLFSVQLWANMILWIAQRMHSFWFNSEWISLWDLINFGKLQWRFSLQIFSKPVVLKMEHSRGKKEVTAYGKYRFLSPEYWIWSQVNLLAYKITAAGGFAVCPRATVRN